MIRIGQLPIAPRPLGVRRRTLPYSGRRSRRRGGAGSARAPRAAAVDNADMIFDQPPAELPVATLRPRDSASQLLLDARGWLAARWQWLRPRAIPVAVAFAGMIGVLVSASYLRDLAHNPPERGEQPPAPVLVRSHGAGPVAKLRADCHLSAAPSVARRTVYSVQTFESASAPAFAPTPAPTPTR